MVDVRKNSVEIIRVEEKPYKGHRYVDIRLWVGGDGPDELIPTRRGVLFRSDLLPEILQALHALERESGSTRE